MLRVAEDNLSSNGSRSLLLHFHFLYFPVTSPIISLCQGHQRSMRDSDNRDKGGNRDLKTWEALSLGQCGQQTMELLDKFASQASGSCPPRVPC